MTRARRPLRVSQHFRLGRTQAELDFVDVDVTGDTRVFISPTAIRLMDTPWSGQCLSLVQDFFQEVLDSIKARKHARAEYLLSTLREPNETHLGLSKGPARGRTLGPQSAHDMWEALSKSAAVRSGLLQDLEETILMIDGVGPDIVSDITTNIIREPLIQYTQEACEYYGIPTYRLDSGPLWNSQTKAWTNRFELQPMYNDVKILLVPKTIVRRHPVYDADYYLRHYVLEYLKEVEESSPGSDLVRILKDGTRKGIKYKVRERYGFDDDKKRAIADQTILKPELLDEYRADRDKETPPLTHSEIAGAAHAAAPDWDALLHAVTSLRTGTADADAYEKAIEGLLSALFYPSLVHPQRQRKKNNGRKRIDITYSTRGNGDFFEWVRKNYVAPYFLVECKNYKNEIGNPELDQLIARFAPSHGKVGLLVCRKIENRALLAQRCRDAAKDGQGYIIALDDADLTSLVAAAKGQWLAANDFQLLRDKFDALVF